MPENVTGDESNDVGNVADVAMENKFSELVKRLDVENSAEQDCDVVTRIRDMFKEEVTLHNDDYLERLYSSNVDVKVTNVALFKVTLKVNQSQLESQPQRDAHAQSCVIIRLCSQLHGRRRRTRYVYEYDVRTTLTYEYVFVMYEASCECDLLIDVNV